MQRCVFTRGTHLGDPAVPAHPLQARRRQDDGGEVLLLVQLLQPRVEIPALGRSAQEDGSEKAAFSHRERRPEGYDVLEVQVWEPLLQLGGPAQRAGADHAAQTQRLERR